MTEPPQEKPQRLQRLRWSLKTQFGVGVAIFLVASLLILCLVEKALWARLELLTVTISIMIFIYCVSVLYFGVRFDTKERFHLQWTIDNPADCLPYTLDAGPFSFFTQAGAEEGPLGCLLGIILDIILTIVVAIVLALVIWLSVNFFVAALTLLCIPLFFLFSRSLRYVVAHGRRCRGNLAQSCMKALYYTIAASVWFYVVVFLAHRMALAIS